MGIKNVLVINDEAHHCYRAKPKEAEADDRGPEGRRQGRGEEEQRGRAPVDQRHRGRQAQARRAYRVRPLGHAILPARLGLRRGHAVPLDDVRLLADGRHRVRHRQAAARAGVRQHHRRDAPKFRNLWDHIGKRMPKKGVRTAGKLDPLSLPTELYTALEALYGHYAKIFDSWRDQGIEVPPVFIVVCNNTATSKLVYDYVSGFERINDTGGSTLENGRLKLFRNYDDNGQKLARPRTLLIDSEQLESGEALDPGFRDIEADTIERFRREIMERTGDRSAADKLTDADLLREVMNTVGKPGKLGEGIRCVVSVSMLTEGWDANTVTHVLGCVPSARSCCANRWWAVRCAGRATPERRTTSSTWNTPTCWASPSTSLPSRWWCRPSRP
jgi:type III restriction enzyme